MTLRAIVAACIIAPTIAAAQPLQPPPSHESCAVLTPRDFAKGMRFTIYEAWVLGYAMGYVQYGEGLPKNRDTTIYTVLDWVVSYCRDNPGLNLTLAGAASIVIYERLQFPTMRDRAR